MSWKRSEKKMSIEINDRDVGGGGPLTIPNLRPMWNKGESCTRRDDGKASTDFIREVAKDEHANYCSRESGGRQSSAVVVGGELGSVNSF